MWSREYFAMLPTERLSYFLSLSTHDVNRGELRVIKQYLYKQQSNSQPSLDCQDGPQTIVTGEALRSGDFALFVEI